MRKLFCSAVALAGVALLWITGFDPDPEHLE
jgi:hypothetical protein